MSDSTIGIKVADGSYYPVIDVDYRGTKKLILTTAKDNQEKVRVDLYRGAGASLTEARYIDSLIIENIPPASQGEPEIELLIGIDEEGQLMAEAFDQSTGERQRFDTSIESLPQPAEGEPDFALEEGPSALVLDEQPLDEQPLDEQSLDEQSLDEQSLDEQSLEVEEGEPGQAAALDLEEPPLTGEDYPVGEKDRRAEAVHRGRPNLLLLVLFVVLGIALVGAIAYFVYRAISGPASAAAAVDRCRLSCAAPGRRPRGASPRGPCRIGGSRCAVNPFPAGSAGGARSRRSCGKVRVLPDQAG